MHVCLVAPNDALNDPRARVMRFALERAGHRVTIVLPGAGISTDDVRFVTAPPAPRRRWRRSLPEDSATRLSRALADEAAGTGAGLFLPTDPRALGAAVDAARRLGVAVLRTPKMDRAGDVDLIDLAPSRPELAMPASGLGRAHTPGWVPPESGRARPGAHAGRRVVLCYRRSEINPGRYLEEALRVAGVDVQVETEGIDLGSVDPDTDAVVFVESPYPALEVRGQTDVPTLFWFHHGEHHLHANLRLADRYRADAVLMAHSWHLAPFAHLPVHRFPFGVATDLLRPGRPLADRRFDVAMVGAKLFGGGPYGRRQQLVAELSAAFPEERLGFREDVLAPEMAELYADSRIVINEGGTRHYPITMRVLEAVGSGAVLLSDRLPGMEMLLEEGVQYAILGADVVADCQRLLADLPALQKMADSALETALTRHTYGHRVDELFDVAGATRKRQIPDPPVLGDLAAAVDRDVEVQRVAHIGAPELAELLGDREILDAETIAPHRLAPGKMESIAVRADDVTDLIDVLRAARRYVYIEGRARGLSEYLEAEQPQAEVTKLGPVIRIDLMAPSYRIKPFEEQSP